MSTYDSQPRILVTGATGFLGGEIAREFKRSGYHVTALVRPGSDSSQLSDGEIDIVEGDITDFEAVRAAMDGQTYVCHAAALVPGRGASCSEFERVNVGGTKVACEAALETGVSRFLYISTAHVFGLDSGSSVNEESKPSIPAHPGYDESKVRAEALVRNSAVKSLDSVIVNPTTAFGPGSRHSGRLINLFLRNRLPVIPIPNRELSLVYSGDVARGARLALELGERGERYILAAPKVTVREFLKSLGSASGRHPPRLSLPAWLVISAVKIAWVVSAITRWRPPVTVAGIRHGGTVYDGSKAIRELGLEYTPLEIGLTNTAEWMSNGNGTTRDRF